MEGSCQVCERGFRGARKGRHRTGPGTASTDQGQGRPGKPGQSRPRAHQEAGQARQEEARAQARTAGRTGRPDGARAGTRPGQANRPPGKQETRRDPNPLVRGQWLVFAQPHGSVSLKRSRLCLCLRCGPLFAFLAWRSARASARPAWVSSGRRRTARPRTANLQRGSAKSPS